MAREAKVVKKVEKREAMKVEEKTKVAMRVVKRIHSRNEVI